MTPLHRGPTFPGRLAVSGLVLLLCGCGESVDNQQLVDAYRAGRPAEVTVRCTVTRVFADTATSGSAHERFQADCGQGLFVEIDHNLSLAPRVPVSAGAVVTIRGQFEPDPGHPVIHYTHHSTSGSHEGGYIELDGRSYS